MLPPSQNVVAPVGVMVGVAGNGLTVTAIAADDEPDEQPAALFTVTLKLPVLFTTILCVVSPVLHK